MKQPQPQPKRQRRKKKIFSNPFQTSRAFWLLLGLLVFALLINFGSHFLLPSQKGSSGFGRASNTKSDEDRSLQNQQPKLPYLPIFPVLPNRDPLVQDTLTGQKPTLVGIAAILYTFLDALHVSNQKMAARMSAANANVNSRDQNLDTIIAAYFELVQKHLLPLEKAYQYQPAFAIRTDDSIFVSVAAFREYLLADTLASLYANAKYPDQLYVGVIVNNCFPNNDTICQGGVQVVGKDKQGKDKLKNTADGVADENQMETFCQNTTFAKYCDQGQVRVLYVHEIDALGPAVARYYSSKLWAGETFYVQIDSHLHFATHWDALYVQELHATKSYPKAILSTYPPGFINFRQDAPFTPGTRLCQCKMRRAEDFLPRVEMNGRYHGNETRPTQMAFCGAGFFFAHSSLLQDVPFDPFLPWMFMGEEIAFSVRAWTHGWNIYAPRQNLIGHQYRPIKFGTPHYWDSVEKLFHAVPNLVDHATTKIRQRVKYIMGYPNINATIHDESSAHYNILSELEHYGLGTARSMRDYLKFAEIDLDEKTCGTMTWCTEGLLE